jgi:hypothetical protein
LINIQNERRGVNSNIELSSPEIISIAKHKINKSGNQRSAIQIFNITIETPNSASKIQKILNNSETLKPIPYSADKALVFFTKNNLTKQQYINI